MSAQAIVTTTRAQRVNGTAAIGDLWGYGSREELADADRIVATPQELGQVFAASSA